MTAAAAVSVKVSEVDKFLKELSSQVVAAEHTRAQINEKPKCPPKSHHISRKIEKVVVAGARW